MSEDTFATNQKEGSVMASTEGITPLEGSEGEDGCGIVVLLPAGVGEGDFVIRFPNGDALSLLCPAMARLLAQLPLGTQYPVHTEMGALMLGVTGTPVDTEVRFQVLLSAVELHEEISEEIDALERELQHGPSSEICFTPGVPPIKTQEKQGFNWGLLGRATLLVLGAGLAGMALMNGEKK